MAGRKAMLKGARGTIWHGMDRLQQIVLIATSLFISVFMFVEVMLRYIFRKPIMGIEEILPLAAFWLYFIGASYGSYKRSHIKAEVVEMMVKNPRRVAVTRAVAGVITFGVGLYLCKWAFDFFIYGLTQGQFSATLFIPMVYSQSAVFFGLILMTFYFLIELIDRVRAIRQPDFSQVEGG
jgi:TRAP-type C4-dicarboxylate transport system permease small subunit